MAIIDLKKNKYFYAFSVALGSLILLIAVFFLMIKPLYAGNQKLSEEVNEKKEKLNALEDKLSRLKELKKQEEKLVEEKKKVLAALPEDKDVPRLFVQFEKMATTTGASVISTETDAASTVSGAVVTKAIPGLNTYDYTLRVNTSTYESFKNIVSNSENALRLLNIDGFSVSKKETSFEISFDLKTYARSEELK